MTGKGIDGRLRALERQTTGKDNPFVFGTTPGYRPRYDAAGRVIFDGAAYDAAIASLAPGGDSG